MVVSGNIGVYRRLRGRHCNGNNGDDSCDTAGDVTYSPTVGHLGGAWFESKVAIL